MKFWKRFLSLALLAALLTAPAARAADEVAPWAREAVDFAVEHGLMSPEDQRPADAATRAELAHMVAALFRPETQADLSACGDVEANAWYAPDMARAVAVGLYEHAPSLAPRRTLTREEAFISLGRLFGVPDGDPARMAQFADSDALSEWAAAPIAGMVEAGYVQGRQDGLDPRGPISRQDLANLLYRLSGTVLREDGPAPERGNLVVPAGVAVPEGLSVQGDLILCASYEEPLVLKDVQVSGRIVVHGGSVVLSGGTAAAELVSRGLNVRLSGETLPVIRVTGGDLTIEAGACESITVGEAEVHLAEGAKAGRVELQTEFSRLDGAGEAESVVLRSAGARMELSGTPEVQEEPDAGPEGVTLTAIVPANEPRPDAPGVTTTVRFDNVGAAAGKTFILAWYVDGKLAERNWAFPLAEGATAAFTGTASYEGKPAEQCTILARLSNGKNAAQLTQSVDRHLEELAPPVDTMHIEATVTTRAGLFADASLSSWRANVERGTVVTYTDYRSYNNIYVTLPDGRTGWMRAGYLQPSSKDFVQKEDYTAFQKERFVNQTGNYASKTNMLVWVSRLTQKVNVFEGSQGNWKLTHAFACCSGKNATPTTGGVFSYYSRTGRWDFGTYYVNRPMLFNGGHAFHTRTYIYGMSGVLLDATMGSPRSHGCVRMYDGDVDWLWNNMKFGTTVVVY